MHVFRRKSASEDQHQLVVHSKSKNLWHSVGQRLSLITGTSQPSKNKKFLNAVSSGNTSAVRDLVRQGADPNAKTSSGFTALYIACARGHVTIVQILLDAQVHVLTESAEGRTALYVAAEQDRPAICALLLRQANVLLPQPHVLHPLSVSCQQGLVGIVQEIVSALGTYSLSIRREIVNVQTPREHWTPLLLASRGGHATIVQVLLETELVALNVCDELGNTALHLACRSGHYHVVYLLLAAGASADLLNAQGLSSLELAQHAEKHHVVQLMNSLAQEEQTIESHTVLRPIHSMDKTNPLSSMARKNQIKYAHFRLLGSITEEDRVPTGDVCELEEEF